MLVPEKCPIFGSRIPENSLGPRVCQTLLLGRPKWNFTREKCFKLTIVQNLKFGVWHFGLGDFPILDFDTNVKIQSCTIDGSVSNCNHSSAILCVFWTSYEILLVQTIDNKIWAISYGPYCIAYVMGKNMWYGLLYIIWFMLFCTVSIFDGYVEWSSTTVKNRF